MRLKSAREVNYLFANLGLVKLVQRSRQHDTKGPLVRHTETTGKFKMAALIQQITAINRQTAGLILIFAAYLC